MNRTHDFGALSVQRGDLVNRKVRGRLGRCAPTQACGNWPRLPATQAASRARRQPVAGNV